MNYIFSDKISSLKASAIREILKFTSDPTVISFAAGNPSTEAFPVDDIRSITADIFQKDPILALQYNITEGYTPFRNLLKLRMSGQQCYNPDIDELIVVSGAQQGIELSCKILCNANDTLICEAPSFIGSLNAFKSYSVNLVGIPLENDGINLEILEEKLKTNKNVRLIYLIPNFQNPTGLTMSYEKRKAVYALAQKYNTIILEDNPYGDIRFDGEFIPSIKSLDTDGRVIYCGSFSKILAPGLRVGYVSAPKEIIGKIVVAKQVSDVHSNILAQKICYEFMNTRDIEQHLQHLRGIYKHKCSLMLAEMERNFSKKISYTKPQGGLFIWATLPRDCDMMGFCKKAVENKVAMVPGNAFMVNETDATTSFRLNFSTPTDEQIIKGCKIVGDLSKTLF